VLVAVEGVDGSGKGTQARLLEERARGAGLTVAVFSFPRYGHNAFSIAAARFLNGEFGDASPDLVSLVYAGDRFVAKPDLERGLEVSDLVICDRYVASNLAHQGARLRGDERARFLEWLQAIEYGIYELPRPALTVLLDMPPATAGELVLRKGAREYTDRAQDLLEGDEAHLEDAQAVYRSLVDGSWRVVDCTREGELRDPEDISGEVWEAVRSLL
jgi:dTMP kinase